MECLFRNYYYLRVFLLRCFLSPFPSSPPAPFLVVIPGLRLMLLCLHRQTSVLPLLRMIGGSQQTSLIGSVRCPITAGVGRWRCALPRSSAQNYVEVRDLTQEGRSAAIYLCGEVHKSLKCNNNGPFWAFRNCKAPLQVCLTGPHTTCLTGFSGLPCCIDIEEKARTLI